MQDIRNIAIIAHVDHAKSDAVFTNCQNIKQRNVHISVQ